MGGVAFGVGRIRALSIDKILTLSREEFKNLVSRVNIDAGRRVINTAAAVRTRDLRVQVEAVEEMFSTMETSPKVRSDSNECSDNDSFLRYPANNEKIPGRGSLPEVEGSPKGAPPSGVLAADTPPDTPASSVMSISGEFPNGDFSSSRRLARHGPWTLPLLATGWVVCVGAFFAARVLCRRCKRYTLPRYAESDEQ